MKNIRGKSVKKSRDWIQEKKVSLDSIKNQNSGNECVNCKMMKRDILLNGHWRSGIIRWIAGPREKERQRCQARFEIHWQKEKRQILKPELSHFFMIDKQLHPFHASIQIHPDFFLALFQRIMLQIRLGKEKYSISRLSSVPLRENSAEQLSICLQYEKCNLTKNKWHREEFGADGAGAGSRASIQ